MRMVSGCRQKWIARLGDESGQGMLEYILVVVFAVVSLLIVLGMLLQTTLGYYEMQAIWISLPIM